MEIFKGKNKEEKVKTRFADNVRVTKNRLTKIPERMMEIDVYPTVLKEGTVSVTEENVESTFKEFLKEHKELFEIEPEDLKLVSAKKINKRWHVKYGQYYKGIPVHNATVGLDSSENGKVSSYASNYQPNIDVPTEPKVKLNEAIGIAKATNTGKDSEKLKEENSTLIIYPEKTKDKIINHLAWKFILGGEQLDTELEKCFIVDALDGKVIRSYAANPDASVSGNVQGEIYPENPTNPVTDMAVRGQHVDIKFAGKTTTDDSGSYAKSVPWYWWIIPSFYKKITFKLEGPYARVQNHNGADYVEIRSCNTKNPCNLTWTATDRDHINVFYHMNVFHDWLQDELGYSWVNQDGSNRFNARVNTSVPNARAGNPMRFGPNNCARSSDIICHECTHNVLYHIYSDYIGWPDAYSEAYAMDEGFADYFSCSFTNESRHGEGYYPAPRDLNNTEQYPGRSSYCIEGHNGGEIIGGAAWDLRQRLINAQGSSGVKIADKLIFEAHQILSNYPRNYYFSDPHESNLLLALYKAADDNNNLQDGFPYFNDIQLAFHAHNLLQAVLEEEDSYDFSTNTVGNITGGDLYYYDGKFWANNYNQKGVKDLGDIGDVDLATINIPTSGYTRSGVTAVTGHTYVSEAQEGEVGGYIAFRVTAISSSKYYVAIGYLYRFSPYWHVANLSSKEIHKLDCHWVSLMNNENKSYCANLQEVAPLIREGGYNGCHYCLTRYDADTLSMETVLSNLEEDLM